MPDEEHEPAPADDGPRACDEPPSESGEVIQAVVDFVDDLVDGPDDADS